MTGFEAPTRRDYRWICAFALISVVTLTAAGFLRFFVLPVISPRVNIRWADTVDDAARVDLERRLKLFAGEQREGTTWTYDLGDPSSRGVKALIADPAVADTFHINRSRATVSSDAPRGTTRIGQGRLSIWRDSPVLNWVVRLALSILAVSTAWLASSATRGMRRSPPSSDSK